MDNQLSDYGLLMGFITTPFQEQSQYVETHKTFFKEYKEILQEKVITIKTDLYKPVFYYTLGKFSLLSLSFIDDFHLGNFSFRPLSSYNKSQDGKDDYAYQYQIINGVKIGCKKEITREDLKHNFLGIVKLKVNSAILMGNKGSVLKRIRENLLEKHSDNCDVLIVTESFSWHEFTILIFDKNPTKIHDTLRDIRSTTIEEVYNGDRSDIENTFYKDYKEKEKKGEERRENHIFVDSQTMFNVNLDIINGDIVNGDIFTEIKSEELSFQSNISIKTGHLYLFLEGLKKSKLKYIKENIIGSTGTSDVTLHFENIDDLINFCKYMYLNKNVEFTSHIRSIESSILRIHKPSEIPPTDECCTELTESITKELKYNETRLTAISKKARRLKLPKNIERRIVGVFTNYSEILQDESLYAYYLELYPIIRLMEDILIFFNDPDKKQEFSPFNHNENDTIYINYRNVAYLSGVFQSLIDLFQLAYQNRFQESKRFGDNSDLKIEFNGGVHQIISTYDLIYKIVYNGIHGEQQNLTHIPVAVFGNTTGGIKATSKDVSINYFHLFQPEFYLTALVKENCNNFLNQKWLAEDESGLVNLIKLFRNACIDKLHDLPIAEKKRYYPYISPDRMKKRVDYFIAYWFQYMFLYYEDKENGWRDFSFWIWHHFMQHTGLYNIDGSIRVSSFRMTLIAYQMVLYMDGKLETENVYKKLKEIVRSPDMNFLLDEYWNECYDAIQFMANEIKSDSESLLLKLTDEIMEMAGRMVLSAESNLLFRQVMGITKNYLNELKIELEKQESEYTVLMRDENGAVMKKPNGAFFDPFGGLFTTNSDFRKKYFSMRIDLFSKLQKISYEYLKEYTEKVKQNHNT